MKNVAKIQEIVLEVTEEEYAADLAHGFQEDEVLRPGRHVFRRGGFLERHGLKPEDARRSIAGLQNDAG
jgi:hypothetical protein